MEPSKPVAPFKLLTEGELAALPPPVWLIDGLFIVNGFAILYGPPAEWKNFLSLDWALHVASGKSWHGRSVRQGPVVYIIGEGDATIYQRVRAWRNEHDCPESAGMFYVREAPQFRTADDVAALLQQMAAVNVKPALIIIDTLARSLVGADENSAKDMGEWIAGAARIQRETGATLLAVHHTVKNGEGLATERGSSSLRGAADTMVAISKQGNLLKIRCAKQKHAAEFESMTLRGKQIDLDGPGGVTSSLVLVASDSEHGRAWLAEGPTAALAALRQFPEGRASSGDWHKAIRIVGKPVCDTSFHRYRRALVEELKLVRVVEGRLGWYEAVPETATVNELPSDCHERAA